MECYEDHPCDQDGGSYHSHCTQSGGDGGIEAVTMHSTDSLARPHIEHHTRGHIRPKARDLGEGERERVWVGLEWVCMDSGCG